MSWRRRNFTIIVGTGKTCERGRRKTRKRKIGNRKTSSRGETQTRRRRKKDQKKGAKNNFFCEIYLYYYINNIW